MANVDIQMQDYQGNIIHPQTNAKVVEYKGSNVSTAIDSLAKREELFISESEPVKDGLWVDTSESTFDSAGENIIAKQIKKYMNDKIGDLGGLSTGIKNNLVNAINENTSKLSDIEKTKFHFLPLTPLGTKAPGDCSLIVTKNGKTVLIDTGEKENYNLIKEYLDNLEITKIDYLIISHYHPDHVNNLSSLMSDFNFSSCIAYIQKNCSYSNESFTASTYYNQVVTALKGRTVNHPTNGDILTIDDISIKFFNCSSDDISYYEKNTTNYNDYSMCCQIKHKNINVLYTGDISTIAQARINTFGFFEKVDLLKVQHHGFDRDVNFDYLQTISPTFSVSSQNIMGYINTGIELDSSKDTSNGGVKSKTLSYLSSIGCKNYIIGYDGGLLFTSNGSEIVCDTKVRNKFNASYYSDYPIFIYVDINASETVSDGTFYKPFRRIQEAISFCGSIPNQRITIKVANGDYKENIRFTSNSSKIKLLGNSEDKTSVKINSLAFDDSNVIVDSINITGTSNIIVNVNNSKVEMVNCTIDGIASKENYYDGRGVCAYNSSLYMNHCVVSNRSACVCSYNSSTITTVDLKGTNNDYIYVAFGGDINSVRDNITFNKAFSIQLNGKFKSSKDKGSSANRLKYIDTLTTEIIKYYDTSLETEMIWNGSKWVDSLGRIRDKNIANGEDLNTYTEKGLFLSLNGTITESLVNAPTGIGYSFELEVEKSILGIRQIIKSPLAYDNFVKVGIFYRTYKDSKWSSWYQLNQTVI